MKHITYSKKHRTEVKQVKKPPNAAARVRRKHDEYTCPTSDEIHKNVSAAPHRTCLLPVRDTAADTNHKGLVALMPHLHTTGTCPQGEGEAAH